MYQPMSQQVSRQNSQCELDQLGDVEEISHEVQKKKAVKKKIIKKIIKKKNPDGTDAPPQVTTIIVDKDGSKIIPSAESQANNTVIVNSPPKMLEVTQSQVQSLIQKETEEPAKKKVKKIIIKKRKKADGTTELIS